MYRGKVCVIIRSFGPVRDAVKWFGLVAFTDHRTEFDMPFMDTAEVIELVSHAKSHRDLKPLVADLAGVPGPVIFEALFPVAIRQQGQANGPVAMSAYALHALNPPCRLAVDDAISLLLPTWDISIEEVPWYLTKQFGLEAVLAAVGRIRAQQNDQAALIRLGTIEYWAKATPVGA